MTKLLLFLSLFLLGSCSLVTDFGDDSNNNDNNQINNTNNQVNNTSNNHQHELCDNGVDDDGDGDADCWDKDCNDTPFCGCTEKDVFFDSPKRCDHDELCLVDTSVSAYYADCKDAIRAEGGEMYGLCGTNGECPMGATCLHDGYYFAWECVPLCSQNHDYCPLSRGTCLANFQELPSRDTISYCIEAHPCNPTEPASCANLGHTGKGCFAFVREDDANSTTTRCMNHGENGLGASCAFWSDCTPGNVCVGDDDQKICLPWCDLREATSCDSVGTPGDFFCQAINADPWGVCITVDNANK